ncbi:hypothetical protein H0E84_08935 [Luteimonas sp. SJ-92]|uniref:Uncharacterized protein n=1 Tax=Luteimonas salinisoli TaxID=2752307 RepID=A0A853JD63_9GAMM|nr:hypothetical protein [Luteimonas salinisoli]NZA26510.1 hypothetical protein [Luteimonas salinisoli]
MTHTDRSLYPPILLILLTVLSACGGKKTESERLAELRDGIVYTRYRQASEATLPGAVVAYQKGAEWSGRTSPRDITQADLCSMRVLLAYGALISDKNTLAIAETDIVDAGLCSEFDRTAATSLRAVAFQRLEWPGLAKQESARIRAAPQQPKDDLAPVERLIVLHMALGYAAVRDGNWNRAQLHFDALGALLQHPWLGDLPRAGFAFHEGRTQDGLITLKRMSRDPNVPEPVREVLSTRIARIEAKVGDVDSAAFMPRLIAAATWEVVKSEGPAALAIAARLVEDQAWQPLGQSLRNGSDQARTFAGRWWAKARNAISRSEAPEAPEASEASEASEE